MAADVVVGVVVVVEVVVDVVVVDVVVVAEIKGEPKIYRFAKNEQANTFSIFSFCDILHYIILYYELQHHKIELKKKCFKLKHSMRTAPYHSSRRSKSRTKLYKKLNKRDKKKGTYRVYIALKTALKLFVY